VWLDFHRVWQVNGSAHQWSNRQVLSMPERSGKAAGLCFTA